MKWWMVCGVMLLTQLAWGESEDKTLAPYFSVSGDAPMPLRATHVEANVNGTIADVLVTQIYVNGGTEPINARYVFPASTHAAVHGMRVTIGDRQVVAKIKEREAAAKEYAAARDAGQNAALLQEQRPNVFTMNVANIMPGDEVVVRLEYSELLVPTSGVYEFVYPTVVGPRYNRASEEAWIQGPFLHAGEAAPSTFAIQANISPGMPVQDLRSPSHDVKVDWSGGGTARVSAEGGNNRDFVLRYRLSGNAIRTGVLTSNGDTDAGVSNSGGESFFLVNVQPPRAVAASEIVPRDYIFVLDVSGSMWGFPLDTAKVLIKNLLSGLRPTDTFDVVLFSGAARLLSPTPLSATGGNVASAISAIEQTRGGGGTELSGALQMAMSVPESENASRSVVVLTDGFIAEEPEALALVNAHLQRTNFFAFGIGSSVNRYLIEGIAHAGQGEPFVVTKPEEAPQAAQRFRQYVQAPVMTDIHVAYKGFDAYDVEPSVQPDLFAERPIVLCGKWRGALQGDIVVSGKTAAGAFTQTIHLRDAKTANGAPLAQLWARTRIARLSDFGFQRDDAAAVSEVTALGLKYSLLTKYTSFIAVFQQVRNAASSAPTIDQPTPMPEGVSDYAVGAEPGFWIIAATALLGLWLMRKFRACT